jgi:hypothetical protein
MLPAYHVTSSRLSLDLRVYSSPLLFFDPVSLLIVDGLSTHFEGHRGHGERQIFCQNAYLEVPYLPTADVLTYHKPQINFTNKFLLPTKSKGKGGFCTTTIVRYFVASGPSPLDSLTRF